MSNIFSVDQNKLLHTFPLIQICPQPNHKMCEENTNLECKELLNKVFLDNIKFDLSFFIHTSSIPSLLLCFEFTLIEFLLIFEMIWK